MITIIPGATIITLINIYINPGLHNTQLTKKPVILSYANLNTCRIQESMFVFTGIIIWRAIWVTTENLNSGVCTQAGRPISVPKVDTLIERHSQWTYNKIFVYPLGMLKQIKIPVCTNVNTTIISNYEMRPFSVITCYFFERG